MTVIRGNSLEFVNLPGRDAADPLSDLDAASSMRVVELARSQGRTAHRHPLCEEVFYVERGSGQVWIDGELTPVGVGDVVHIPAGAGHATIPDVGADMRVICFFPHPHLASNHEDTGIDVVEWLEKEKR